MHSIAASPTSYFSGSTPTPPAQGGAAAPAPEGDLLSSMQPAMDAAFAVGAPMDQGGAAAILATNGAYIAGANATISKLDVGIEKRERELQQLRLTNPEAAAAKEESLELLRKLRDRIELSIERVSRIAAGETDIDLSDDADPRAGGGRTKNSGAEDERLEEQRAEERARVKREQETLLEQRRTLLAPTTIAGGAAPHLDSGAVAGAYAASAAPAPNLDDA